MTTTKGRRISDGIMRTASTPIPEPISEIGNSRLISHISTLPDFTKVTKLVSAPITAAALFVPSTVTGGSPVHISAGIEISPPPPTTESINDAIKPKNTRNPSVCISKNSIPAPQSVSIHSSPYYSRNPSIRKETARRSRWCSTQLPIPATNSIHYCYFG